MRTRALLIGLTKVLCIALGTVDIGGYSKELCAGTHTRAST